MCMHAPTHYKLPSVDVESAWRRRNCALSWGPQCPQPTARFLVSVWGSERGGRLASLSAVSFLGRKSLSRCTDLEKPTGGCKVWAQPSPGSSGPCIPEVCLPLPPSLLLQGWVPRPNTALQWVHFCSGMRRLLGHFDAYYFSCIYNTF